MANVTRNPDVSHNNYHQGVLNLTEMFALVALKPDDIRYSTDKFKNNSGNILFMGTAMPVTNYYSAGCTVISMRKQLKNIVTL